MGRSSIIAGLVALVLCPEPAGARRSRPGLTWVKLRGGEFQMGLSRGHNARPVHRVTIKPFSITRTEVTVAQYRRCARAGTCDRRRVTGNARHDQPFTPSKLCNWGRADGARRPMNCVSWRQARAFCRWAGGRLPTEAEWEYAATSGGLPWRYPWGNQAPTCRRAVMDQPGKGKGCGKGRAWPVCSRPAGNTRQGLCDMAGNVWEWTADCWHHSYEGAPADGSAWTEACEGAHRVVRGGAWIYGPYPLNTSFRQSEHPGAHVHLLGFRCAR